MEVIWIEVIANSLERIIKTNRNSNNIYHHSLIYNINKIASHTMQMMSLDIYLQTRHCCPIILIQ